MAHDALVVRPLTPERWDDFTRLFGPKGACAGCWCIWPRLPRADYVRHSAEQNKSALRRIVKDGEVPGLIGYVDGEPAVWCALAPRARYRRLERSRVMAPVDDRPVWSVVCFFTARRFRGAGLTRRILKEAVRYAAAQGARIVEGYPVDAHTRAADAFVFHGLVSAFRSAGFKEVARRSPTRPIMRRAVRPTRAGRAARQPKTAAPRRTPEA